MPRYDPQDQAAAAINLARGHCIICGKEGELATSAIARAKDAITAVDTTGYAAIPVMWCGECATTRDDATAVMRAAAAGDLHRDDPAVKAAVDFAATVRRAAEYDPAVKIPTGLGSQVGGASYALLEAAETLLTPRASLGWFYGGKDTEKAFQASLDSNGPRWAGTHSFADVRRATRAAIAHQWARSEKEDEDHLSPTGFLAIHAIQHLDRAHPIVVDPRQVDALPELTPDEAHDYGYTVRLPFESVYIDMVGPDGAQPEDAVRISAYGPDETERSLTLQPVGAVLWHTPDGLWCIPFARAHGFQHDASRVAWGATLFSDDVLETDATIKDIKHTAAVYTIGISDRNGFGVHRTRGFVVPGITADLMVDVAHQRVEEPELSMILRTMSNATFALTEVALRVLHFLDSANVDVVQAPLHRRDRKRAEKRRWPIASTVAIKRRAPRRRDPDAPVGEGRNFAYQFERAGHYNHVVRGAHVRCVDCKGVGEVVTWRLPTTGAVVPCDGVYLDGPHLVNAERGAVTCATCGGSGLDADKVKPCTRRYANGPHAGSLTCPDGCRREWVPTTVVGDPGKPLMLKTRRVPTH